LQNKIGGLKMEAKKTIKYYKFKFKKDYLEYLGLPNAYDPIQIECARRKEFPEDYVSKDKMEECL
jgi:hypothetical protein